MSKSLKVKIVDTLSDAGLILVALAVVAIIVCFIAELLLKVWGA